MKKFLYSFLSCFLLYSCCWAQKESNIWVMSWDIGIDFNSGSPVRITTGTQSHIGPRRYSTICDANGNLLFYTNGIFVWDRNDQVMPNGIFPNSGRNYEGVVITSMPGNIGKYYIFGSSRINGQLLITSSIVDMSLNNGLGDVEPATKEHIVEVSPIPPSNSFGGGQLNPRLVATKGNGCSIWLVVSDGSTWASMDPKRRYEYRAYHITSSGVSANPVVSTSLGAPSWPDYRYSLSDISFSKDGNKFAASFQNEVFTSFFAWGGIEIYDFNKNTGALTNAKLIGDSGTAPSLYPYLAPSAWYNFVPNYTPMCNYRYICFSPDGTKIYAETYGDYSTELVQFDISLSSVAAINNSRKPVMRSHHTSGYIHFRTGPDNKLYALMNRCLPNSSGYCDHRPFMWKIDDPDLPGAGPVTQLTGMVDSFNPLGHYLFPPVNVILINDTTTSSSATCIALNSQQVTLPVAVGGTGYMWNTGDTGRNYKVNTPGIYSVKYTMPCKYFADTFVVLSLPQKTDTYSGYSYAYMPPVPGAGNVFDYTWKDVTGNILRQKSNVNDDTLKGLSSGTYYLQVNYNGCSLDFNVNVRSLPTPDASFNSDSITCTGQPITFANAQGNQWLWDFGDGHSANIPIVQHAYSLSGSYTITLMVSNGLCSNIAFKDITVKELELQLATDKDKDIYNPGDILRLFTSANEPYSITAWLPKETFTDQQAWEQKIKAGYNDEYWVIGISDYGCMDTAIVNIAVRRLIPSAFSPNGDGLNDIFRPANPGVYIRSFEVYNRFGQRVWSGVGGKANAGWDGSYANGQQADIGTYYWSIETEIPGGKTERDKGDVTLVR